MRSKRLQNVKTSQSGSVLVYLFIAVGLLAALSYSFTKDNNTNLQTQISFKAAKELISQANLIRSAILECTLEFSNGGPDLNDDGGITTTENPNNPFPLLPTDQFNTSDTGSSPGGADDSVRFVHCINDPGVTGDSHTAAPLFQGAGTQGRFLPPAPNGWNDWVYHSTTTSGEGVWVDITATSDNSTSNSTVSRALTKFNNAQADDCGTTACLRLWIKRRP